jgi:hypothetical protein
MPVTADSTLWTADTTCVTADGRIICIDAVVAEPVGVTVTADTTLYKSDNATWPTADGGVVSGASDSLNAVAVAGGAVISADVAEAAAASDLADAVSIVSADAIEPASASDNFDAIADVTASVAEATTALDQTDAAVGAQVLFGTVDEPAAALDTLDADIVSEVVAVPGGGARYRLRRPLPVYGVGYGILPQLWGEAHGTVGVAGKSAAQIVVHADAVGACGQAGDAAATLKGLSVAAHGAVGTRGTGSGMIVKFNATATGRLDDDEAAVIAFLIAA